MHYFFAPRALRVRVNVSCLCAAAAAAAASRNCTFLLATRKTRERLAHTVCCLLALVYNIKRTPHKYISERRTGDGSDSQRRLECADWTTPSSLSLVMPFVCCVCCICFIWMVQNWTSCRITCTKDFRERRRIKMCFEYVVEYQSIERAFRLRFAKCFNKNKNSRRFIYFSGILSRCDALFAIANTFAQFFISKYSTKRFNFGQFSMVELAILQCFCHFSKNNSLFELVNYQSR